MHADAHIAVSVADEGRGVAPERLAHLFDKHAGAAEGGAPAGHGLGLAICKGLVEAHGGRIRAESAGPGRGATVTFALPVAGEPGAGAVADPPRAAGEKGERARILAVDDDPHMLCFARDTLTRAGYAPLVTAEPQELAHLIRTEKPRLVLLDLVLPGGNGIELMHRVPELSHLPVIFISGYSRDETVAAALESGAADYIVKPFSPTELVARVRTALRRHEAPEPFVLGALAIDYDRRRVSVGGESDGAASAPCADAPYLDRKPGGGHRMAASDQRQPRAPDRRDGMSWMGRSASRSRYPRSGLNPAFDTDNTTARSWTAGLRTSRLHSSNRPQ